MKIKISIIQIIMLACFFLLPALLHAQPDLGGDDVNDAPIDGGLSLLVAAGVGYGMKKVKEQRKKG